MKKYLLTSITAQLTALLIGSVLLSLLVTGGILIYASFQAQSNQLKTAQQVSAQMVSEKVNAYFDDLQRKLTYLARVRGLTTFDAAAQRDLLEGLLQHNKAYEMVGITDNKGRLQLAATRRDGIEPQEWGNTLVFRRAFQEQEDYIGPVELLPQAIFPTLILAVPVRDDQNRVGGMLFARVNLEFLWALLDEIKVGKNGYVYILNPHQLLIAQSGSPPEQSMLEDVSQNPLGTVLSDLTQDTQRYRGLRGVEVLGNKVRITSNRWYVVVERPVMEVYAPLFLQLVVLIGGLMLSAVILGMFSLTMARRVTQPLQHLTRAATQLSRGELETRVVIEQENEFKILADAFNQMAAELSHTIVLLQQDITTRKQVEEALREQNEFVNNLLENSPVSIYVDDADGQIRLINRRWEADTGFPRADILGLSLEQVFPVEVARKFRADNQKVLETGEVLAIEEFFDPLYLYTVKFPLRDSLGKIVAVGGMSLDITDSKKATQRAFDLALEKERMAILTQFIVDACHEFRTPLAIMQTDAYLLDHLEDPAKRQRKVAEIREQATGISRLVNLMVEMAHIDGGTSFTSGLINLNEWIAVETAQVQEMAAAQGVNLHLEADSDLPTIQGDGERLIQALHELLMNAVSFTPPGGMITVRTASTPDTVMVEVQDTGCGIPPEALPHIFERFYRQDEAHTMPGFGLGLPVARAIVERHGGRIEVESEVGVGSVFRMILLRSEIEAS